MKLYPWQNISSRALLILSPWLTVIEDTLRLPNGRIVNDFYRIDAPDYVLIFAKDANEGILMERHYKHCIGRIILTCPAGGIEAGETPIKAAKRELFEETGYRAGTWRSMGAFKVDGTRGVCTAHLFSAENLELVSAPQISDMEEFELSFVTIEGIRSAIQSGDIALLPDIAILAMATSDLFSGIFENSIA